MSSASAASAAEPSVPPDEPADAGVTTMRVLAGDPDVFETFFDAARIGLALADLSGCYVRVNATYAELLGRDAEDLIGVRLLDVLGRADGVVADLSGLVTGTLSSLSSEQYYTAPDGRTSYVLHAVASVADRHGLPGWFAVSAQDITERRRAEQELRELTNLLAERAVRDPLTGLANRSLLEERLRAALARDTRTGQSTGVLFLDLDGFKAVNDDHGHAAGDTVLQAVADRLRHAVRPSDTVARLGGDEFVVLVEAASGPVLQRLAERLGTAVREPVVVDCKRLAVGVSIGVALSEQGTADPLLLLSEADERMYDAKRRPH